MLTASYAEYLPECSAIVRATIAQQRRAGGMLTPGPSFPLSAPHRTVFGADALDR
jgi:hypothetical protein